MITQILIVNTEGLNGRNKTVTSAKYCIAQTLRIKL